MKWLETRLIENTENKQGVSGIWGKREKIGLQLERANGAREVSSEYSDETVVCLKLEGNVPGKM